MNTWRWTDSTQGREAVCKAQMSGSAHGIFGKYSHITNELTDIHRGTMAYPNGKNVCDYLRQCLRKCPRQQLALWELVLVLSPEVTQYRPEPGLKSFLCCMVWVGVFILRQCTEQPVHRPCDGTCLQNTTWRCEM